jgi:ATP-GRASP peptide maturase of grasp-with-spasm system
MVKIYSESTDYSTSEVIFWLNYYGIDSVRIDVDLNPLDINAILIAEKISNEINFDSVWWRRPLRGISTIKRIEKMDFNDTFFRKDLNKLNLNMGNELKYLNDFLISKVDASTKVLGNYAATDVNKYIVYQIAKQEGIYVPETLITNSKKQLNEFIEEHGQVIVKLHDVVDVIGKNGFDTYATYTELITDEIYKELPNIFFPNFFQKYIEKQIEIRTFYLEGNFYSMAMFTQQNSQTSIDFRRYDRSKMNRRVPYKFPKDLEVKLRKLMKKLNLNTGSMDVIKNLKGDYYFLEVNPIGQFGMVSNPCNYYLYKKIADYLK